MITVGGRWEGSPEDLVGVAEDLTLKNVKKVVLDLYDSLVDFSPVLTGRFQSNWKIGINKSPNAEHIPKSRGNMTPSPPPKLSGLRLGDDIFIENGQAYADKIENGSSTQAPNGVVARALAGF